MNRADFLKRLAALPFVGKLVSEAKEEPKMVVSEAPIETEISFYKFYEYEEGGGVAYRVEGDYLPRARGQYVLVEKFRDEVDRNFYGKKR